MGVITEVQAMILDKQNERRMLQYQLEVLMRQRRELRLKQVHSSKEALKAKFLTQYDLDCKAMADEINRLADEIFALEQKGGFRG